MGLVKTRRLAYPPLAGFATHRKANTPSDAETATRAKAGW